MLLHFFILFPFLVLVPASPVVDYLTRSCSIDSKHALELTRSIKSFSDFLVRTFGAMCEDPESLNLYRSVDTSVTWSLLCRKNELIGRAYKQLQAEFVSIKNMQSPECCETVRFFTEENVDRSSFAGVLMRMISYGFLFDNHSSSCNLPLKVMLESRKMKIAEKYFDEAPCYVEHLVEFLSVNARFFQKQVDITEPVLKYIFKHLLDLNLLTLMMHGDFSRDIRLTGTIPEFVNKYIEVERHLVSVDGQNFLLNKQSRVAMFFKSWLYLTNTLSNTNERRRYFDERRSIEENVELLSKRVAELNLKGMKKDFFELAVAYDCLNHYARLIGHKADLSHLREQIIKSIIKP